MNPNQELQSQFGVGQRFGDIGSVEQSYSPAVAQQATGQPKQMMAQQATNQSYVPPAPVAPAPVDRPMPIQPVLVPQPQPVSMIEKVALPEPKKPMMLARKVPLAIAASLSLALIFGGVAITQVIRTQRLNAEVVKNKAYLSELQEQSEALRSEIADIRMGRKAVLGVGSNQPAQAKPAVTTPATPAGPSSTEATPPAASPKVAPAKAPVKKQ